MPVAGFHSEWVTLGRHRVLLECRASYPDKADHFIAGVVAEIINHNGSGDARLVHVYYNDKASIHHVTIASTNQDDLALGDLTTKVLQSIYGSGNYDCDVQIIERGNESSDHYEHMEHLSVGAGLAEDRWQHGKDLHNAIFGDR
ncbi:hypothetical protein [Pseudomonas mosselii]|uniref:Uncharacterized protein n=1 Tax=Pseudomonas mosselii TaxID=78327 RepID=A0ABX9B3X4_9PSED|nr:hypothetical protein [Pseudomonas mosselii]QZP26213.1 hypothetical protein K5H97_26075 [Pseudomonas mosselii]